MRAVLDRLAQAAITAAILIGLALFFADTIDYHRATAWWRSVVLVGCAGAVAGLMCVLAKSSEGRSGWTRCLVLAVVVMLVLLWFA